MITPNSTPINTNRLFGLDLIKVIACFLVVALHTCEAQELFSLSSVFYYSGVVAIPLFFMVHGYLLFGKTQKDKWYSYKKIGRILLLVCVLNLVYCIYHYFSHNEVCYPWKEVIKNLFLQRGYFFQFWFFGALVIIYAVFPVLDYVYQHHKRLFVSLSVVFIGCQIFVDALNIFWAIQHSDLFQRHIPQTFRLESHLSYFLLGGCLKIIPPHWNTKVKLKHILLLYVLVMAYQFVMVKFVYPTQYCEYFYDNILVIGFVITLFLYFSKREREKNNCVPHVKLWSIFYRL
jgi:surface polysaccharide O-acyltransferase-like enzyme